MRDESIFVTVFLPREGFSHCCCNSLAPGSGPFVSVCVPFFCACEFVYLCVKKALA